MTGVLLVIGAMLIFILLAFGAALLVAAWMGAPRAPRRRKRNPRN